MAAEQYDYQNKLGLQHLINMLKTKIDGYLDAASDDTDSKIAQAKTELRALIDAIVIDAVLSTTSTNAIQNQAVTNALAEKAPLANPVLTGTPTAPTALAGNSSLQIANTTFVQNAINSALAGVTGIDIQVVDSLPSTGVKGTFYFVAASASGERNNAYMEYVWVNNAWEKIGDTTIDLSGYVQRTQLVPITDSEIDAMLAAW